MRYTEPGPAIRIKHVYLWNDEEQVTFFGPYSTVGAARGVMTREKEMDKRYASHKDCSWSIERADNWTEVT